MTTTPSTTPTQASVTANAESALSVLASAVDSLKQELDATMARKYELLERRIKAYASPLTPADIRQFVGELIGHRASFYAQRLHEFKLAEKLASMDKAGASNEALGKAMGGLRGLRLGMLEGNTDEGYIALGTGIGNIRSVKSVAEVVNALTVE